MTLFADEGLDVPLVLALRANGFHVLHALETMRGSDDEAILAAAAKNEAVLVTKDKDFGEMIVRNFAECKGVVLVRIDDLRNARNIEYVVELFSRYSEQLPGHFTVMQEDKIRIRKLT